MLLRRPLLDFSHTSPARFTEIEVCLGTTRRVSRVFLALISEFLTRSSFLDVSWSLPSLDRVIEVSLLLEDRTRV